MGSEINWLIPTAVGAVVTGVITWAMPSILDLPKSLRPREKHLLDTWYGYYYISKDKEIELKYEEFKIEKRWFDINKLNVRVFVPSKPEVKYEGKLYRNKGYLLINMHPMDDDEEIFFRFRYPMPADDGGSVMVGLWSALDFSTPTAAAVGPAILSKRQLTMDEVKNLTEQNIQSNQFVTKISKKVS